MARINASSQGVKVDGLNELNRALRALGGKELQQELKGALSEVASDVASDARANAYSLGGVAAKVAPTLKAAARNTGGGVSFGGASMPYAMGAEFGSDRYKQFRPWRGSGSGAGYFVYEAIRDNADSISEKALEALNDLVRKYDL